MRTSASGNAQVAASICEQVKSPVLAFDADPVDAARVAAAKDTPARPRLRAIHLPGGFMSVRVALAACLLAAAGACTVGAPPGFSSGDSWAIPLVGPLEDGALLVPVKVDGKGPFLFLVDPDAPMTSIDEGLAKSLDLYGRMGPRLTGENGTSVPTRAAEVHSLTLGTLTVSRRTVLVHDGGILHAAGRDLFGVLGRDIIAESLVFTFDRDSGMAYLATREVFEAPEGAVRIKYEDVEPRNGLMRTDATTRRMVTADVNGTKQSLHLDFGAFQSQLRADRWKAAHLTPLPYRTVLVDETFTARKVDKAGIANQIAVGPTSAMGVLMVPYDDQRTDPEDVDGSLGLNFFAHHVVWADWSGRSIYVKPRDPDDDKLAQRLARWDSPVLAACKKPGCVTASLTAAATTSDATTPTTQTPPTPTSTDADADVEAAPVEIEVVREASAAELIYEATLEAVGEDNRSLGLPRLVVTLPRGATTVRQKVSPVFAGAHFRVADVSPFVRACKQPGGCIFELAVAR
jgi:hypothetical protein